MIDSKPMPFPLPLVPFEEYMLAEDTASYPRIFVIEASLSGALDQGALEAAWAAALARHPLLTARLARIRGRWRWTEVANPKATVDWAAEDVPLTFARDEMIDLAREAGVRLWARVGHNRARLVLQFHHSCCDGVGGLQFLGDLLAEYAERTAAGGAVRALPPLDAGLLAGRGSFGLSRPTFREWLGHAAKTIRESIRLMGRTPLAVEAPSRPRDAGDTPLAFPGLEVRVLGAQQLEGLRQTAKQAGATLNDLLMCHLLGTIVEWNAANSGSQPDGWLRINVPTNLRRAEDMAMPAANVMSFTFVDRHTRDCHNPPTLLASIRDEMEVIKRGRLGLYFIAQLALVRRLPWGMRWVLGRNRCFATAVLTNLGDSSKTFAAMFPRAGDKLAIGNLVLENIVGMPPLRALTRVGVGIGSYAGQLSICLLCDRHCFTRQEALRFLEMYVARIRRGLPS